MNASVRSIPGITEANKKWHRDRSRERLKNSVREPEVFADDLDFLWPNDKPHNNFAAIQQNAFGGKDTEALDDLLSRHGLRALLCTLHGLVCSRVSHDVDDPFADLVSIVADEKDSRQWEDARDVLTEITLLEEVNAK